MSHAIITDFENFKSSLKLLSSYGNKFFELVDMDGKVRTRFNQILTTGRVSSSKPNMQQIPVLEEVGNRYRNCFIPSEPGWVLVDSDYTAQELCVIADMSQDPVWLKALADGKDLHSVCAHMMYGKKWEDATEPGCAYFQKDARGSPQQQKCSCKKHKTMRYDTKALDFGLAYGMSQFKLKEKSCFILT